MADRRIGFNLDFKANTKDIDASLKKLKDSLQEISKIKAIDFKGSTTEFNQMKNTAQKCY